MGSLETLLACPWIVVVGLFIGAAAAWACWAYSEYRWPFRKPQRHG